MDSAQPLQGRTAIVTGASRGIGLAIAQHLSRAGAGVVLVGRDTARLDVASKSLDGEARSIAGDVANPATIDAACDAAIDLGGRIDMLVNNAGGPPHNAPMVTMAMEAFDTTIDFNMRAPLLWTRAVWARSMRVDGGAILNIASIGGLSLPRAMGSYAIAKAALLQMTRVLAAELGPRVRVNAIAPGVVRTDATAKVDYDAFARILPAGRVGKADDIAAAALFLLGDGAGWITGETLVIDGGTLVQSGRLKPGWDEETGQ